MEPVTLYYTHTKRLFITFTSRLAYTAQVEVAHVTMTLDLNSPNEDPHRVDARAHVLQGEDAAIGAFRFSEHYGMYDAATVIRVRDELDLALPEGYEPDEEVRHKMLLLRQTSSSY